MRVFHLSLLLILLFTSCKDEMETQAELTAKKIKADINSGATNIQSISVLDIYDATPIFVGSSYVITSDGFIVITTNADESATFNLGELKSYVIASNSLILYY
jgi:hypothetical protein